MDIIIIIDYLWGGGGSLISAQALFFLRALFGAKRIHSYRYNRMASSIRRRCATYTRRVGNFGEQPLGTTVPQDENLSICTPSGLEPPRSTCSLERKVRKV